jgi:hypothetical protein
MILYDVYIYLMARRNERGEEGIQGFKIQGGCAEDTAAIPARHEAALITPLDYSAFTRKELLFEWRGEVSLFSTPVP